ncbi:flavodoxin domain-containing protein [Halomicrococcus sp. NG-SE-24]|uniref:flavodoxin domain-containing protein n=1 Tax=Halomicrococcus sp. NG-SE-24 TaxID=3436928 RepID=UPI003D96CD89
MPSILIAYGTGEGQTKKVAEYIDSVLERRGLDVTTTRVSEASDIAVSEFDGVLIGASVNNRRHQPEVLVFVERHGQALADRPSGFFQLSLASAISSEWAREEAMDYVEKLTGTTGWHPDRVGLFAGALKYTQYDFKRRWLFKLAALAFGLDTDTSRDYEYTDWDDVERFATSFGEFVGSERSPSRHGGTLRSAVRDTFGRRDAALSLAIGLAGVIYLVSRRHEGNRESAGTSTDDGPDDTVVTSSPA